MNTEKLKKLQSQVRIGGKGTPRRKKKVVHATAATDDKKLQSSLKKLSVNVIPGIEEVNMIKDDATVIHFNNPKAQASLAANTFAITGHGENKQIAEMLPGILTQLGPEGLNQLKRIASSVTAPKPLEEDDEVPNLVGDFDEASKTETKVSAADKPEADKAETNKAEPNKPEPNKPEPNKADATKVEATKAEPKKAEATKAEPKKPEATKAEPKKAEPSKPETNKAETKVADKKTE